MYKNHNYPFNVIFLSTQNCLHFYSKNLVFETQFSLEGINKLINNNPNNFQIKNIYDEIYLMYSFENVYVARLHYCKEFHSFKFELINYENLNLQKLHYTVN